MQPAQPNLTANLITLGIIVLVLVWRMRKLGTERPLKLKYLWARPIYVLVVGTILLIAFPLSVNDLPWLAGSALGGGVIGWYWGRTTSLHVHPENGTVMTKSSRLAIMVLVLLIVVRVGLRSVLQMESGTWHLSEGFITDVFVVFAAGLLCLQSLEIFLRSRRVLREGVKA